MKKIIVAFDAIELDESVLDQAVNYAKHCNGLLLGVLLHDLRYSNYVYGSAWDQPIVDYAAIEKAEKQDKLKIEKTVKSFYALCKKQGVHHKLHVDKGVPIDTLIHETTFADLLIVSSALSFSKIKEREISLFVKDILHESQCPVLVIPEKTISVQKNIFCYDGSISSMKAIRMFAYVFPEMLDKPTIVVTVNETTGNHLSDNSNVKDWLKQHFTNIETEILHGQPEREIYKYLKKNGKGSMVIMGAYGRSSLSRFFHHSVSNPVIKNLQIPTFIAH